MIKNCQINFSVRWHHFHFREQSNIFIQTGNFTFGFSLWFCKLCNSLFLTSSSSLFCLSFTISCLFFFFQPDMIVLSCKPNWLFKIFRYFYLKLKLVGLHVIVYRTSSDNTLFLHIVIHKSLINTETSFNLTWPWKRLIIHLMTWERESYCCTFNFLKKKAI